MEPLTPLDERSRHDLDRDSAPPGRGALVALVIVAVLVVVAVFLMGGVGGELEDPLRPAPTRPGS